MVHELPRRFRVPVDRRVHQDRFPASRAKVDRAGRELGAWRGTLAQRVLDKLESSGKVLLRCGRIGCCEQTRQFQQPAGGDGRC
jgi:hypothetical protein